MASDLEGPVDGHDQLRRDLLEPRDGGGPEGLSRSDLLERIVALHEPIAEALADEGFRTPLVRTPLQMIRQGIAALVQGIDTERALERH